MPRGDSTITVGSQMEIKAGPARSTPARCIHPIARAAATARAAAAARAAPVTPRVATSSAAPSVAASVEPRRSTRARTGEAEGSLSRAGETGATISANAIASASTTRPAGTPVVRNKRPASAMDTPEDGAGLRLVGYEAELERLDRERAQLDDLDRIERAKVDTCEENLEKARLNLEAAEVDLKAQLERYTRHRQRVDSLDLRTAELTKLKDAYESYEKRVRTQ